MKVAFVVNRFPALSETFILDQITGLIDQGHEVDIYSKYVGDTGTVHPSVKKYDLMHRVYYFPSTSATKLGKIWEGIYAASPLLLKNPKFLLQLINFQEHGLNFASLKLFYSQFFPAIHGNYDIIHCHFAYMGAFGLILRQLGSPNSKVITTFHGHDVNVLDQEKTKRKYKWLFQHGDLYTANTNYTKARAIDLGCPAEKIAILPVGLNLPKYIFRETQFPVDGTVKVLTVARLVEKKGIQYSIKAVAKALETYSEIEYTIIGDGYLRSDLENLVTQLGISSKVKFLGWKAQDEIIKAYQESHIFTLSSVTASDGDKEGQGLVLQEAQAIGLPVLSTLHNGIPDGVLDGQSGFLVPEKNVEALAEKLLYLIHHPNVWANFSQSGRGHIEKNYNIRQLNEKLVTLYQGSRNTHALPVTSKADSQLDHIKQKV